MIYLATAPKSNAAYTAFGEASRMARETGSLMPPMHILNAPTRLMRDLGYGKGYVYDHATEEGFSGQNYFPDGVARRNFYRPSERGFEREVKKRLDYWDKLRQRAADKARLEHESSPNQRVIAPFPSCPRKRASQETPRSRRLHLDPRFREADDTI